SFFSLYHTSTTAIYTLSLHDALPISHHRHHVLGDLHLLGLPAPLRADTRGPGERDPPLRHLGVRHRDVGRAARDGRGGRPGHAAGAFTPDRRADALSEARVMMAGGRGLGRRFLR